MNKCIIIYQFSGIDQDMDGFLALLFQSASLKDCALCQASLQFPGESLTLVECVNRLTFVIILTYSS